MPGIKIQIMVSVYKDFEAPVAPEGYTREKRGVVWQYNGVSPTWEAAQAVGKQISQQDGVSNVEVYNVALWQ